MPDRSDQMLERAFQSARRLPPSVKIELAARLACEVTQLHAEHEAHPDLRAFEDRALLHARREREVANHSQLYARRP